MSSINFLNFSQVVDFLMAWMPVFSDIYEEIKCLDFEKNDGKEIFPGIIFFLNDFHLTDPSRPMTGQCLPAGGKTYVLVQKGLERSRQEHILLHELIHAMLGYPFVQQLQDGKTDSPESTQFGIFINEIIAYAMTDLVIGGGFYTPTNTINGAVEKLRGCQGLYGNTSKWCDELMNSK